MDPRLAGTGVWGGPCSCLGHSFSSQGWAQALKSAPRAVFLQLPLITKAWACVHGVAETQSRSRLNMDILEGSSEHGPSCPVTFSLSVLGSFTDTLEWRPATD